MNKFKVGDRARTRAFIGIEPIGSVVYISGFLTLVKFDDWGGGHAGSSYYEKFSLEHDEEASNHWWFDDDELVLVGKSNE